METARIKKTVDLLKKVNCQNYALISETAKEMGVKKTALMQFIEENPKLFKTTSIEKRLSSGSYKPVGLAIKEVFLSPEENPDTEEWLEARRNEWEKRIHVGEQTYYNCHEYWFIPEDDPRDRNKLGLYRNTPEKIRFLEEKGIIKKQKTGYGGLGDYYRTEVFLYNRKVEEAIRSIGWSTDFKAIDDQTQQ